MLLICYYSILYSEFKARIAGIWPPLIEVGISLLLSKNAPQLRPLPSPLSPLSSPKRPVDVKREKSEYIEGP